MRAIVALWLGLLTGTAQAAEKLVVLEVEAADAAPDARRAWTDAVRLAARRLLPPQVKVLRRADIDALLGPGQVLAECDADCAVEAGQRLGVDQVITARLTREGVGWHALVAHSRTRDGRLLGQGTARDAAPLGALEAATRAALAPRAAPSPAQVLVATPVHRDGLPVLRIDARPPARIHSDGVDLGETPVELPVTRRFVPIVARAPGYFPREAVIDAGPVSGEITLTLRQSGGIVELNVPDEYPDLALTIDGTPQPLQASYRLLAGRHRFALQSRCARIAPVEVEVGVGTQVVLEPAVEPRCVRLSLAARHPQAVQLDGIWYTTPATTHRVPPGRHLIQVGRGREMKHPVDVPEGSADHPVDMPEIPFGIDLNFAMRRHAGGQLFVRAWDRPQDEGRIRTGIHVGLGLAFDDLPAGAAPAPDSPDSPDSHDHHGFGGLFLGYSLGLPITRWLEWVNGVEVGLVATSDGPPAFIGAQSGIRLKVWRIAVEGGWGAAAHALVDRWDEAHGGRLTISLTE